jgi:hypothetical protein
MCDAINREEDSSLRFLVEVNKTQETLWQLRPQPRRFSYLNDAAPKSLHQALSARELTGLEDKRRLALTFAYALIQCYGSPCIKDTLQKDSIYFCSLTGRDTDFGRPFLPTQFSRLPMTHGSNQPNMALQHRNPAILNLGVLLLEVHKGMPLERLYTPAEADSLSPNTDLFAARRLVDELGETASRTYQNAIRACLEIPWVIGGEKVDLTIPKISSGFYVHVIRRLEAELSLLLDDKSYQVL